MAKETKVIQLSDERTKRSKAVIIKPNDPLYQTVMEDLTGPLSYYAIARKHGLSMTTVRRIATEQNLVRELPNPDAETTPEIARDVKRVYDHDRRLAVLDKAFEKVESLLDEALDPQDLQKLISSIGTLVEKRRLEDGESTSRTESLRGAANDELRNRLNELAKRQAAKDALEQKRGAENDANPNQVPVAVNE